MATQTKEFRVLGLDPSTRNYGWAFSSFPSSILIEKGTEKTKAKDFEHDLLGYVHHREHLRRLAQRLQPDVVAIESPTFGQNWSEGQYALFQFSLEALWLENVDFIYISNSETKAWVRRYLQAPSGFDIGKREMIKAAKRHTGVSGKWSSHEADAYIAAVLGGRFWAYMAGLLPKEELTEYEELKFDEVYTPSRGSKAGISEKRGLRYKQNDRWFKRS